MTAFIPDAENCTLGEIRDCRESVESCVGEILDNCRHDFRQVEVFCLIKKLGEAFQRDFDDAQVHELNKVDGYICNYAQTLNKCGLDATKYVFLKQALQHLYMHQLHQFADVVHTRMADA